MDEKTAFNALILFSKIKAKKRIISFYGGEPLLAINIIKKIVIKSEKLFHNPLFVVTTNMILSEKYADFLTKHNFHINVSLDGPWNDEFRKTKDNKGSYKFIKKGIKKIRKLKPKTNFTINALLHYPEKIQEMRIFFKKNYPKINVKVNMVNQENLLNKNLEYEKKQISEYKNQMKKLAREYIEKIKQNKYPDLFLDALFRPYLTDISDLKEEPIQKILPLKGTCTPGKVRLFIGMNGIIGLCEKCNYNIQIGYVNSGISTSIQKTFAEFRNKLCNDCFAQRICKVCYASAIENNKLSFSALKKTCASLRNEAVDKLCLLVSILKSVNSIKLENYIYKKHLSN
jgi:uncharacterized protein